MKMNAEQNRNVEQAIDDLCENLVWARAYLMVLKALHMVAKSSPASLEPYPQFVSCLYHGMFDCLFIKMHNFFDLSKGACGFPHLFKLLRRYVSENSQLMAQVAMDDDRLKGHVSTETIKIWRNEISAHLTQSYRCTDFFSSNSLHLSELETLLNLVGETVESYSFKMLGRINDTANPSADIAEEIERLFWLRTEPSGAPDRR